MESIMDMNRILKELQTARYLHRIPQASKDRVNELRKDIFMQYILPIIDFSHFEILNMDEITNYEDDFYNPLYRWTIKNINRQQVRCELNNYRHPYNGEWTLSNVDCASLLFAYVDIAYDASAQSERNKFLEKIKGFIKLYFHERKEHDEYGPFVHIAELCHADKRIHLSVLIDILMEDANEVQPNLNAVSELENLVHRIDGFSPDLYLESRFEL